MKKYRYLSGVFLPVAALVGICAIMSAKRYLWFDELLTYYLTTDTSLAHMLKALADRVDHAPPLYFIFTWLWVKLFGASVFSLRLTSCLGICGAGVTIYIILYRLYKFWPAFIGTSLVFLGSSAIVSMTYEARFYGLFLAECALAIFFYYKACSGGVTCSRKMLLLQALVHGAMPLTHPYGFFYSAAIIFALFKRDAYFGISRKKVYFSMLLGWCAFLPWVGSFCRQTGILTDDTWVSRMNLAGLLSEYNFGIEYFGLFLVGIGLIFILAPRGNNGAAPGKTNQVSGDQNSRDLEKSIIILVCALFLVPVFSWVLSWFIPQILVSRYLLPTSLGYCFVAAALFSLILRLSGISDENNVNPAYLSKAVLVTLSCLLLLIPLIKAASEPGKERPGVDTEKVGKGFDKLPIVSSGYWGDGVLFLQARFYAQDPQRYVYLLDQDFSSQVSSFFMDRMMGAVGRNYLPQAVRGADDFLAANDRFLLLNSLDWYFYRIRNNPAYAFRVLERRKEGGSLILVQKVPQ